MEFPDFYEEKRQALRLNPESYRVAFDRHAINGAVSLIQAVRIFGDAQAASASLRYQNLFERELVAVLQNSLERRNSETKGFVPTLSSGELRLGLVEVSFEEFSEAVQRCGATLAQINIGPSEPSALYAAKLDPKVITSLTEQSRYSTDLGEAGVQPMERGLMTGYGGMDSTTNDLMYGTKPELSNQVRGTAGHIPKKNGKPTLQEPRPDQKKSVKDASNANLPGYTGHWPTYGIKAKTEGVSVSIETTTGSSQALAAALARGWRSVEGCDSRLIPVGGRSDVTVYAQNFIMFLRMSLHLFRQVSLDVWTRKKILIFLAPSPRKLHYAFEEHSTRVHEQLGVDHVPVVGKSNASSVVSYCIVM